LLLHDAIDFTKPINKRANNPETKVCSQLHHLFPKKMLDTQFHTPKITVQSRQVEKKISMRL
jgi:hypothetical protein